MVIKTLFRNRYLYSSFSGTCNVSSTFFRLSNWDSFSPLVRIIILPDSAGFAEI